MKNKNTLLISGGTGSFGQTVLNKFLNDDFFNEICNLGSDMSYSVLEII